MKICATLDAALAVPGVVHIESGDAGVIAYQTGDKLPDYCVVPPSADEPSEMEQLKAQVAALQAQFNTVQEIMAVAASPA